MAEDQDDEGAVSLKEIIAAAVLFALAVVESRAKLFAPLSRFTSPVAPADGIATVALCFASYLICARKVVMGAARNIARGKIFDEKFLMTIASLGAVLAGETLEAVAVMLFYQAGEFLEDKAVGKSRASIESLAKMRPDKARVKRGGKEVMAAAEDVEVGETIVALPGERIPLDGVVVAGESFVDASALTGEAVPVRAREGSEVMALSVNGPGVMEIRTTARAGESGADRIIRLVERSSQKKARSEKFITSFSRVYTPAVCAVAAFVAVVPSIVTGDARAWIYRALIFLVVSCPCALVISVPLAFFCGIGRAGRAGLLVKGGEYMETLSRARVVAFDKTGTLTKGTFSVTGVHPAARSEGRQDELLAMAAHAESVSNHPVSRSIREAHSCPRCGAVKVSRATETAGQGLSADVDGERIFAGNEALMKANGVEVPPCAYDDRGTVVHLARNGLYEGHIVISDEMKDGAALAARDLRDLGVEKIVMLTGDNEASARSAAEAAGVDEVFFSLSPEGKVAKIEGMLGDLKKRGGKRRGSLVFAGDGVNDAPALALADVGVAMGALGSDAAVESADVVAMTDEPGKIAEAVRVARKTMRVVKENIVFSLAVKALIMAAGAAGVANMWTAVFGDTGVALLATLNSLRAMRGSSFDKRGARR